MTVLWESENQEEAVYEGDRNCSGDAKLVVSVLGGRASVIHLDSLSRKHRFGM